MKCGFNLLEYKKENAVKDEKSCPDCSTSCSISDSACKKCGYPFVIEGPQINNDRYINKNVKPLKPEEDITSFAPAKTQERIEIAYSSSNESNSIGIKTATIIAILVIISSIGFFFFKYNNPSNATSPIAKTKEIDTLRNEVKSNVEDVNKIRVRFIKLMGNVGYPECDFLSKTGEKISIKVSDLAELSSYPSFFCDESDGQNHMINPYFKKEFELTFDKPLSSSQKKIIDIKLLDKVDISYIFVSPGKNKYELRVKDLNLNLEYSYMDYREKTKVHFIMNWSLEKNEYDTNLYELTNYTSLGESPNSDVIFFSYNSESGDYDTYFLVDSIIH